MKIGIDARCLQEGRRTGVAEYASGVFWQLLSAYPDDKFIFFFNYYRPVNCDLSWIKKFPNAEIKRFRYPNKLINLSFWLLNWPKVDKMLGGTDVFFMPNPAVVALGKKCKKILTIHDLSFERFPETFSFKRRLWHFVVNPRKLCRMCHKIWAVSESTKQDVEAVYRIDPGKIEVIYPPFDNKIFSPKKSSENSVQDLVRVEEKYNLPEKFFLFMGTIEPRKNIESLVDAFEQLKKEKRIDHKLVIAGGKGWLCEDILNRIFKSSAKDDIILTGFVPDEDKPALYRLASVFVYPSIFEGFGYPPIEAMAAGVPTITSNCSSLPEVAGDSAILVDPYRPYEITIALRQLLEDGGLYELYSRRGEKRAEEMAGIERILNLES